MAQSRLVSAAIQLPIDPRLRESAERALAAIDRVHLVVGLPRIRLDQRRDDPRFQGRYHFKRSSRRAVGIGIDPNRPSLEFTILHELGHFLDHQALGQPRTFASPNHPDLTDWRRAVEETPHHQRLMELLRLSNIELARITGSGNVAGRRQHIRYLLAYSGGWARSYSQYIALKAQDVQLLEQLAVEQDTGDVLWNLGHWSDETFAPIAVAIDDVLQQKGWLR